MSVIRKRSWSVPAVGLGSVALLAGGTTLSLSRSPNCEETSIVTSEAECARVAGPAHAARCIPAFAAATARQPDEAKRGVFIRKTRSGTVEVQGVVREPVANAYWQKLDGTVADRVYRSCNRRSSGTYARTTRSWSGGTRFVGTTTSPRPSTVARGGFGRVSSGIRASS